MLRRFLHDVAGIAPDWTPTEILTEQVEAIRATVGSEKVICGLSGGVDSAVAAALVHRAVGDQLTCVFVDHGLLRAGEREQVERDYVAATGINLVTVDAADRFLDALAGVTDPETKRKIIGREFIRVFESAAATISAEEGGVKFLVQGTLYPDVVESGGGTGTATIKSHHNVGGLPDDLKFALVEPLRTLFKDEVRLLGAELGLPGRSSSGTRSPARGSASGSSARSTAERLEVLRAADAIVRDEMTAAGRRRADLAVPGGAAGRRPLGRRAGRRPHLRPPDRAAPGVQRGRHDGRLVPAAVRPAGQDLQPDHRRGAGGQPGGAGCDEQAAGHHRVGVSHPRSDPAPTVRTGAAASG